MYVQHVPGSGDLTEVEPFSHIVEYFRVFSEHPRLGDLVNTPISELYSLQSGKHSKDIFAGCIGARDTRLKYVLLAIPYDADDSLTLLEWVTTVIRSSTLDDAVERALCTLVVELHDVMVCALPPQGGMEDRKTVQAFRRARDVFVRRCEPFPRDCEAPTSGFPYYPEWGGC